MPESVMKPVSRLRLLKKYLGGPFINISEGIWSHLPPSLKTTRAMRPYGDLLHFLVRRRAVRNQYHATFFLRNRPELALISALARERVRVAPLRLTVVACSNGAEVFSILWTIRSAMRHLEVETHAIDISESIVEIAKRGRYSLTKSELMDTPMFERLSEEEIQELFDRDGDEVSVKPWIKRGIDWRVADAGDPGLASLLGPQDIVVANRFLCHMNPPEAEKCLRNIGNLVAPGGYLFVSGLDLDIRTKVALDLGWTPVQESMEAIHDGDISVREGWPLHYWGLEPFTTSRRDWKLRYASVFQLGTSPVAPHVSRKFEVPVA